MPRRYPRGTLRLPPDAKDVNTYLFTLVKARFASGYYLI